MRRHNPRWWFREQRGIGVLQAGALLAFLAGCSDAVTDPRFATGGPSSIGSFTLPAVEVTACQYGGWYPDCKDPAPSGGTVAPTSPSAPQEPSSGGGTSGGGTPVQPPDTTKRPACNTGDPVLDSKAIQDVMRQLWLSSNPTATSTWSRKEQGGWIVSDGHGGYSFMAFNDVTYQACSITPNNGSYPVPPPGVQVIAWLHTHPYEFGEWAEACKYRDNGGTGIYIMPTYKGGESSDDDIVGNNINTTLAGQGQAAAAGYVIDNDGISRFRPIAGTAFKFKPINRCGY
jgi:hypothetical protein